MFAFVEVIDNGVCARDSALTGTLSLDSMLADGNCRWALLIGFCVFMTQASGCHSANSERCRPASPPPAPQAAVPPQVTPIAAGTPPKEAPSAKLVSATEPIESPPKPLGIPSEFEMLPPVDEVAAAFPQTPTLRLSLFDAIETGLLQNPDLTAARQAEGVSFGALGVARTYPFNPFLQITATPIQQRTDGQDTVVYHYVLVMQTLQLAHQQRYREEIGMAALTSVRWNILQAELNNIAQTERLYFTATYLRGVRDLMVANAELNEQLLSVSEKQLQAGQVAGADVAIVRLDRGATRRQARLAEANYQTALLDLRRQLNIPLSTPIDVVDDLTQIAWQSAMPEHLLEAKCPNAPIRVSRDGAPRAVSDLVAGRPDVLAARADLSAARSAASLARASRVPDLVIGPYYQRTESGTYYYGFRTQNDIPVINNGMPLLRQRQAEARQRQAIADQLMLRAEIEAEAAIDRYERARTLLAEFEPQSASALPAELERLEEQFKANEVDVIRVHTSRTSLIQLRRSQLDLLNEVAQAAANVVAATGAPPQAIVVLGRIP